MVKIAIAGGSSQIASEIIDVLVANGKHEILILSRKDSPTSENRHGITWAKTAQNDIHELTKILTGIHTLLVFGYAHLDAGSVNQKTLIDAAIAAGVKRVAPNEWSGSSVEELPWYAEKDNVKAYLKEINKEKKVIEYSLFQPGFILDYLAPQGSSKYMKPAELFIDPFKRRAIVLKDTETAMTLTTVNDLAHVVAGAIDYHGEWPVTGGVRGNTLSSSKLLDILVKATGGKDWDITHFSEEDVRSDTFSPPWVPKFEDSNLTAEQIEQFSKLILKGSLLSGVTKSWVVSDEWNRLLPEYKFKTAEEYFEEVWARKG